MAPILILTPTSIKNISRSKSFEKKVLPFFRSKKKVFFFFGSKIFKKHCFRVRGKKFLVVKNPVFWPQNFSFENLLFYPDPKSGSSGPPPQNKIKKKDIPTCCKHFFRQHCSFLTESTGFCQSLTKNNFRVLQVLRTKFAAFFLYSYSLS